jgi:hypothetical protein
MDDNQNEQSATFSLGASKRPVWKLVNNGKGVYMFNANGLLFKMFFNDDMTPDKATVAQMAKLIKRMSCTVLNVITSIINGMYIYEKDPSYYLEYPNIEDFYGNSATSHIIVRFPNTENAVRLADADRVPEMNQNIADIDRYSEALSKAFEKMYQAQQGAGQNPYGPQAGPQGPQPGPQDQGPDEQ